MAELYQKSCYISGCFSSGKYPAPKSPEKLDEKVFLCLEHIRYHNLNWNYFQGMSEDEIINFQKNAIYFQNPTWRFGINDGRNEYEIHQKVSEYLRPNLKANKQFQNLLPQNERKALKELELTFPTAKSAIKKAYKRLAKLYHPDQNNNETVKFIRIKNAYDILITSKIISE